MRKCFYLVDEWALLQNGPHERIVKFCVDYAKKQGVNLSVCVHNKRSCDQYLKKCFGDKATSKLLRQDSVYVDEVSVILESVGSLKNKYQNESKVYLLLFPSKELLRVVDEIENASSVTVFSEANESGFLESWRDENSPNILSVR